MKKAGVTVFLFIPFILFSQSSLGRKSSKDVRLFEYFQSGQYNSIIQTAHAEKNLNAEPQLLLLLSQLKTGQNSTHEIQQWLERNKDHPLESLAKFSLAQYTFYKGDSLVSKKYLSSVRPEELSEKDKASYGFMNGVYALQKNQYKTARKFFNYSAEKKSGRTNQLTYYQAFISYHLNDNNGALAGFEKSSEDPEFQLSSHYFIAKIHLEMEEYSEVIRLARNELSEEVSVTNSGFYQLLGEAYSKLGELAKADAFFERAIEKHPSRPSSALYYQAGVTKFKVGNTDKALKYLTESGIGTGPYAKLSAFQLGRLHIQRKEAEKALAAFIEASSSDKRGIKEESINQSAKLNVMLGRYSEAINYANDYLKAFPAGKWEDEMQDLLAQCYLKTSDYEQAVSQLEGSGIKNIIQEKVYQKVTFQKALLSFNDGDFSSSQTWFVKSLKYPHESSLVNEAYFFLGEINLHEEKYATAINSYQQIDPITFKASYGIAYALYNQQKYQDAISFFESAIPIESWELKKDARLRMADCLYAIKDYPKALNIYKKLPQNDYTIFQQGMILRNLGKNTQAIVAFDQVASGSNYRDDAVFYKALISFENASFIDSESGFSTFINGFSNSPLTAKAYLNRAISRSNLEKYDLAREDYVYVLQKYMRKEEAYNAILGLQDLQQKGVKVSHLDKYIAEYKETNPEDGSLEIITFESSKALYYDLAYKEAIPKLNEFLKEYPQSKFRTEASYYLADSYYRENQLAPAKEIFVNQKFSQNIYTSRILNRLGEIHKALLEYDDALETYQLLLDLNYTEKDNYNATRGLMYVSFLKGKYAQAIDFADRIIDSKWKPLNADQQASMIKAKAHLELGNEEQSKAIYNTLSKGEDQFAAEATYIKAYLAYKDEEYEVALNGLFDLNARLASYSSWIEKSYLLIAQIYITKNELFQAKATLRSIIQHSENEETTQIAQEMLRSIEQKNAADTTNEGNQ